MPALLGTSTTAYRVGQAAVQRIYLGQSLVLDNASAPSAIEPVPPPSPSGVPTPGVVTVVLGSNLTISWRLSGANMLAVDGQVIQQSVDGGRSWSDVAGTPTVTSTVSGGTRTMNAVYPLSSVLTAFTLRFRVAAVMAGQQGAWGVASKTSRLLVAPATPTGLSVVTHGPATAPRLLASWNASTGSAGAPISYKLQASTNNGSQWSTVRETNDTSVVLGGPEDSPYMGDNGSGSMVYTGFPYVFRVVATYPISTSLESGYGYYPPASAPSAPTTTPITLAATEPDDVQVFATPYPQGALLSFTVDDRKSPLTRIDAFVAPLASPIVWPTTPTLVINNPSPVAALGNIEGFVGGLVNGTEYEVRARAANAIGEGAFGFSVRFTPSASLTGLISNFVVTTRAAGTSYTYSNGISYPYPASMRAVNLSWAESPYAAYTPVFEIQSMLRATGVATVNEKLVFEDWKSVIHDPPSRMSNKPGNTVDNLLPNATYQFRVREVKGLLAGPWAYSSLITTVS